MKSSKLPRPKGPYPLYDPGFVCPTRFPAPLEVLKIYERLKNHPAVPCLPRGDAQLEKEEINILLHNEIIERHVEPARGTVKVYKLKENKRGVRRGRLIVHPPEFNEVTRGWLKMPTFHASRTS